MDKLKVSIPLVLWLLPAAFLCFSDISFEALIILMPTYLIVYSKLMYDGVLQFSLSPKRLDGVLYRGREVWIFKSTAMLWYFRSRQRIYLNENRKEEIARLDELFANDKKKKTAQLSTSFLSVLWTMILMLSSLYFYHLLWYISRPLHLQNSLLLLSITCIYTLVGLICLIKLFKVFSVAIPLSPSEPLNTKKFKQIYAANFALLILVASFLLLIESRSNTMKSVVGAQDHSERGTSQKIVRVGQARAD